MDKRIRNLENKLSNLDDINKKKDKNISLESKINSIWLKCLDLISRNKISEAYNLIISSKDDIYLLRLVYLTGPVLNSLDDNIAIKVLKRII